MDLDRELDRVKTKVFIGQNAAFLGSLMCNLTFSWRSDIKTAATNGKAVFWNPDWFQKIPFDTRVSVLVHELWHVAQLHMLRRGNRHPRIWNYAADLWINNTLRNQGYTFEGTSPWLDYEGLHRPENMSSEEIYDFLIKDAVIVPAYGPWGMEGDESDIEDIDPNDQHTIASKVVQAAMTARMAGSLPGSIEEMLTKFLAPKLPWHQLLSQWFTELVGEDYTYTRPNRRYQGIYLPSLRPENDRLEKLAYYFDVSGSVTNEQEIRFNSEFKYIKETFNPKELLHVQFDTEIQVENLFTEDDPFEQISVIRGGGTSLVPVREHMIKHQPTAAVIFSDLHCNQMQPLPFDIPVIWVAINNESAFVPFGKLIHIQE